MSCAGVKYGDVAIADFGDIVGRAGGVTVPRVASASLGVPKSGTSIGESPNESLASLAAFRVGVPGTGCAMCSASSSNVTLREEAIVEEQEVRGEQPPGQIDTLAALVRIG